MKNRRNFLMFLGLSPIVGASAVLAHNRKDGAPDDPRLFKYQLCFTDLDNKKKCGISVGKDGHLWLKINDKWQRIVTE